METLFTFIIRAFVVIIASLIFPPLGFILFVLYVGGGILSLVGKEAEEAKAKKSNEEANVH